MHFVREETHKKQGSMVTCSTNAVAEGAVAHLALDVALPILQIWLQRRPSRWKQKKALTSDALLSFALLQDKAALLQNCAFSICMILLLLSFSVRYNLTHLRQTILYC